MFSFNTSGSAQDLSGNNSLALCPRRPQFCSTPAAPNRQPDIKSISISDSSPGCSLSRNNVRNSTPATDRFQSPFHLQLSVTNSKNSLILLSQESVSSQHAASAPDDEKSDTSPQKLLWPVTAESSVSDEHIAPMQPSDCPSQAACLSEVVAAALSSKCTVKLEKLPRRRLLELMHRQEAPEARMTSSDKSSRRSLPIEAAVADTVGEAAVLMAKLKEECLCDKFKVKLKRVSSVKLRELWQGRHNDGKPNSDVSINQREGQVTNRRQSNSEIIQSRKEETGEAEGSVESSSSDKDETLKGNRKKNGQLSKLQKKKRNSTFNDRPATNRKPCVSGLSVTRWKNKDFGGFNSGRAAHNKTGDSSINEMMAGKHKQPRVRHTKLKPFDSSKSQVVTTSLPFLFSWQRVRAEMFPNFIFQMFLWWFNVCLCVFVFGFNAFSKKLQFNRHKSERRDNYSKSVSKHFLIGVRKCIHLTLLIGAV